MGVSPAFYLPGHCVRLKIKVNSWMTMIIFDANTPVDENTTRSFVVQVRNFFRWGIFDKDSVKRTLNVFEQDAEIVEAHRRCTFLPPQVRGSLNAQAVSLLNR